MAEEGGGSRSREKVFVGSLVTKAENSVMNLHSWSKATKIGATYAFSLNLLLSRPPPFENRHAARLSADGCEITGSTSPSLARSSVSPPLSTLPRSSKPPGDFGVSEVTESLVPATFLIGSLAVDGVGNVVFPRFVLVLVILFQPEIYVPILLDGRRRS